jgi:hypothetical protein
LPIRRALDQADGHKSEFRRSMKQLMRIALVLGLIGIPLLFTLVNRNTCFTDKSIIYRPFIFAQARNYDSRQIGNVQAICEFSKSGWGIGVVVQTNDGTKFDINQDDVWQREPFTRIVGLLRGTTFDESRIEPRCPPEQRAQLSLN